jgi:hypothetical protein
MSVTLVDVFGSERDEKVVLSVCAVRDGARWALVYGTLLVVP